MFQENSIETCILSRVKQITGPGWMHETGARTWCSGRTWRERVWREVGVGIGMGKTCEPKAFSFQCMTKFTTNKKKKKLKKKKEIFNLYILHRKMHSCKVRSDYIERRSILEKAHFSMQVLESKLHHFK